MQIAESHTPTQATQLIEMLARMLPEERLWKCDHCGTDITKRGVIDLSLVTLLCKECYKEFQI